MWNWLATPLVLTALIGSCPALVSCTAESTRIAIENIPRVEENQDVVKQNFRETALIYMYADMLNYLQHITGHEFTKDELATVQQYWQDRDKLENWSVYWERARALRIITIDTKLMSDQATLDLIIKKIQAVGGRATSKPAE